MSGNAADPLHVENAGLPALNDEELSGLIEIGEAGGMWPRSRLHPLVVKVLLDAALVWPKGQTALGLTARGTQVLAVAAKRAVGDA
jgi:hypothetical protein